MKRVLAALFLAALVSAPAFAERINLYKTGGYGALKQFYNVGNDAKPTSANITIVESTSYTSITVNIDGKQYGSSTGGGAGLDNSNVKLTAQDGTGQSITLNAHFSTYRTYVGSGRGQHWVTHWTLESGTIDR